MGYPYQPLTLDELAAEAVRLGRQIARDVRRLSIGRDVHEHSFAQRGTARLERGEPFDPRDEGSLEAIEDIIRMELRRETLSEDRVFRGFITPEGEAIGDVGVIARVTDRGQSVAALRDTFLQFQRVRGAVLDRVAAERALQRPMQS